MFLQQVPWHHNPLHQFERQLRKDGKQSGRHGPLQDEAGVVEGQASDDGLARGQRNGGVTRVVSNATESGRVSSINGMTCVTGGRRGSTWFVGGSESRSCDAGL